jgi:HK97 gp10 family phage protein
MADPLVIKTVKADTAALDALITSCPERADEFVRAMAFTCEAFAKDYSAVDTGAQKNGIFTKTSQSSGFDVAAQKAIDSAAERGKDIQVSDPTPDAETGIAYVAPSTEYSVWQEFGTSKMAAHPFLYPAMEQAAARAEELAKKVFAK